MEVFTNPVMNMSTCIHAGPLQLSRSMECLMAALENPDMSVFMRDLMRSNSDQRLSVSSNNSFFFSVSSDEGLGGSELGDSSANTSPDLISPPFISLPPNMSTVGELSKSNAATEAVSISNTPEEDKSKLSSETNPTVDPAQQKRRSSPQDLSVDECKPQRLSVESIAAEEPHRRRSRRRASKVLLFAQATADKFMHVPSLLERYQVASLACCCDFVSSPTLRELISTAPRNTEGQNYKLSYEREPQ